MPVSLNRTSTFPLKYSVFLTVRREKPVTDNCTSRTKHCWQNYVDYHKCVNAKGEDFRPCRQVLSRDPAPDFREVIFYFYFSLSRADSEKIRSIRLGRC